MENQTIKTFYSKISLQKATKLIPILLEMSDKTKRRMIQCEYVENDILQKELIPFEQTCIVPVFKNDPRNSCIEKGVFCSRNSCVEKGVFHSGASNDKYHKIYRGEGIPAIKLYLDDETFSLLISTFGKKLE